MRFVMTVMCSMTLVTATVQAANTTWDGSESYDWQDPNNWSAGVPINSDYQSDAYIGTGTPGTITNIPNQSVRSINFTNAGWTLQGGFNFFKDLSSAGAGTNTITGNLNEQVGSATYDIAAGNTLVIGGYLRHYDDIVTVTGGGTLIVDHLRSATFGSPEFRLQDITLRVQDAKPYSNSSTENGEVHLLSDDALLEVNTANVNAVIALFGLTDGGIFDDEGGTSRLQAVYNTDTGYTEVSLIPEPATLALAALAGAMIGLPRRHARDGQVKQLSF